MDFAPEPVSVGSVQVRTTPLESKWTTRKWRREALVMGQKYGRGVLATKDLVDLTGDVWAVPAPFVALMLG